MSIVSSADRRGKPARGPLQASVRQALNETALQLSLLQRRVGARLELKDADFECLNLINTEGPLTPSALARRAGLHPATITGVLDRLERGGWAARARDPENRRAVLVSAVRERNGELFGLLSGMNAAMSEIMDDLSTTELQLITDFLTRTVDAGRRATDELAAES